jgi:hypothetical protein
LEEEEVVVVVAEVEAEAVVVVVVVGESFRIAPGPLVLGPTDSKPG